MNSRTEKYYENNEKVVGSRTRRNEELYKDINKTELDNFEVRSNATVIGNNKGNIDVEKIKSILDTHYNDAPKRKSIKLEPIEHEVKPKTLVETKEYDINVILDKAKGEKIEDYQEDRNKKIRDTQFDILNNLDIDPKDYIEDYEDGDLKERAPRSGAAEDLQKLIDTIALNEEDIKKEKIKIEEKVTIKPSEDTDDLEKEVAKINEKFGQETDDEDSSPLDIFEDLKGDENTTVLEGLQEKTQNMIEDMQNTISAPKAKEKDIDDSFYTKSTEFKKGDFEEYEEFEDVDKGSSPIVKIIIIVLVIILLVGIGILVKSFL